MIVRNLGRTLVILGVLGIILCLAWWASYYNNVVQALGPKSALTHPLNCLLWTADICVQPKIAAKLPGFLTAYNPRALWAAIGVLLFGLILVAASRGPETYPQTPPGEPRPFFPRLEPFYAWVRDLSWPIIRIAVGGTYLSYGLTKVMGQDVAVFAERSMAGRGLVPGLLFAYVVYFLETVGAVMIMLGL